MAASISWSMALWSTFGGNPSANFAAASLVPTGIIQSLVKPFNDAVSYMPNALTNAKNAVQIQACANIFGTPTSRLNGFDPANVLTALYSHIGSLMVQEGRLTKIGGTLVSSRFVYSWYVAFPGTLIIGAGGSTDTALYIPPVGFGFGPRVNINIDDWNQEGRNGNIRSMALTLLHEMGHVYNSLRSVGSGGAPQILEPDGLNGNGHKNDVVILNNCLPL
jgi:hypothetical protein